MGVDGETGVRESACEGVDWIRTVWGTAH